MRGRKMRDKSPDIDGELMEERFLNFSGGEGDWMLTAHIEIYRYQPTKPTVEEAVRFAELVNQELGTITQIKHKRIYVVNGEKLTKGQMLDESLVLLDFGTCFNMFFDNGKEIH